jgi:8-oxo-dGTP pyrophosphatase MutT (NUDIX family)
MPVIPKDAASVILLRDDPSGGSFEVLMVRKHARSEFAGDMHVFPGGAVEESDCGEGMAALCTGIGPDDALSILGDLPSPARALGIFVAGVRETFEEAGILLARETSGELVSCKGKRAAHFATLRKALLDGRLSFQEMIAGEGLMLALDRLVHFAHWITPELSPIRFDTHFFLAPAPPGQKASPDSVETTAHLWISPREALDRNERGTFAMLPPTIVNLMALTRFSTVEETMATTAGEDIPVIAPKVSFRDGNMRLILPGDPDYE